MFGHIAMPQTSTGTTLGKWAVSPLTMVVETTVQYFTQSPNAECYTEGADMLETTLG